MTLRRAIVVLAAAVLLAVAPEVFAQGCVACRTSAAAGGVEAARALDHGVLVLLIPTLSIFVGILVFAFRYRK